MRPRLFHTLVLVGASLTGTVGLAVIPAAVGIAGCGGNVQKPVGVVPNLNEDMSAVDMAHEVVGLVPSGDLATTD